MLKQLKIENFRCFKSFELNHLGRVNLLVGKNNSGKTSILEAIKLFHSRGDFQSLKQILFNRNEYFQDLNEIDLSHLFYNHKIFKGRKAEISGIYKSDGQSLHFLISKLDIDNIEELESSINLISKMTLNEQSTYTNLFLQQALKENPQFINKVDSYTLFLRKETYNQDRLFDSPILRFLATGDSAIINTEFITPSSLTANESLKLFNKVVLTPEEDLVYEALQIIEPKIQRIAPIGTEIKNNNSRGGFFVRLSGTEKRIPIGSMGDGIWRMLGLSLALVAAKDGVLLVDEIDTGLHYTALEDMWKLIWETSKKLNVQVFATTHSSDCWTALEVLANRDDVGEEDISIQRIEKDSNKSVPYNKEEIAVAAEREIEVR